MKCILFLITVFSSVTYAYPEFVGYSYSSCINCHYNGNGGGSLTDYGRAVWAAEITSRRLTGKTSDEQLARKSNFLFGAKQPSWLKPSIKTRILQYISNPGAATSESETIVMQAEANLAIEADKKANYVFVVNYGYLPNPTSDPEAPSTITREHYFRWKAMDDVWVYLGLMPKTYGLRIVDHTAFSRTATNNSQNDQSHGVIAEVVKENWEASINAFVGNLTDKDKVETKGFAATSEFNVSKDWRLGASIGNGTSDTTSSFMWSVHSRKAFGHGNSLLAEIGNVTSTISSSSGESKIDSLYFYTQATQRFSRGYHFFLAAQGYKPQSIGPLEYTLQFSSGIIAFVFPRVELRLEGRNTRHVSETSVQADSWTALGQIHVAL